MKILYLTISYPSAGNRNLYTDLVEELKKTGHDVTVVMAEESAKIDKSKLSFENNIEVLRVKVGNQFGVGLVEKGITTLKVKPLLKKAINRYLSDREYDLILYSTPPVTLADLVVYCKKKYKAKSYLMLKDIFPQNGIDLNLFSKKNVLYKYFRLKEKKLYQCSDRIGCMSNANINFVNEQEEYEFSNKLELFPNTMRIDNQLDINRQAIRNKYELPMNQKIFIFGGNLGKPQAIDFLLESIRMLADYKEAYFLIVGDGAEKNKILDYINKENPTNLKFIAKLPREEYDKIMKACDVGLILLNSKFTIPNYPSRIMTYLHESLPILAATDAVTDIQTLVVDEAKCGYWCESVNPMEFVNQVKLLTEDDKLRDKLGENGRNYLAKQFDVKLSVKLLENFIMEDS
ncbi:glycosyltransferase family 4 protein [Carnobacterium maltaromaticum]|uniref:glycosyltransferase family 4 protein n=1 Tax=Carnobacterium maltaromaticum TaxID=2751 RepID=UPI0039AF08B8